MLKPGDVFLDDGLGRSGCACAPACQRDVRTFRATVSSNRAAGVNYIPLLPDERGTIPPPALEHGIFALATFDLDAYPSYEALMDAARTATEKRGRINREIARAERNGYIVKPFPFALHVPDIVAIHQSKEVRDGRPIKGLFYHQTVHELGGAPQSHIALEPPECPQHHLTHWGVFRHEPGYSQGAVVTNERLVGYVSLLRRGNAAWYSRIMGHGEHLKYGVMYLLHYALVRAMMAERPRGLRYLVFFEFARRPDDPRVHWKTLLLFRPCYLMYADDRPVMWPRASPIDAEWRALLRHASVIETARAPGLVERMLREGTCPSLETLAAFAPRLLPAEVLAGTARIAVILDSQSCGIDTLFDLQRREDVLVVHDEAFERARLRRIYGDGWTYAAPAPVDADLIIAENAAALPRWRAQRLLLAMDQAEIAGKDDATLSTQLSEALGRSLTVKARYFRWGEPNAQSWVWVEIN